MSTLQVTTVQTANGTTSLTLTTGNNTSSKVVVDPTGSIGLSVNSSANVAVVNTTGIIVGNSTVNSSTIFVGNSITNSYITSSSVIVANGKIAIGNTSPSLSLYVNGSAAGAVGTLTDGATITPDYSTFNNFSVTLGGNRTLANPTNLQPGQSGVIWVSQDATGSRTLAFGSYWKFPGNTAPTLTTTASAVDAIVYSVRSTTSITAQALLNVG